MIQKLGVISLNIQNSILKVHQNIIALIQHEWPNIIDHQYIDCVQPKKYNVYSMTLLLESSVPPLYIAHISQDIIQKANTIIGQDKIKIIRFIFRHS